MCCQMHTGAMTAYTADSRAKLSANQSFSTKLGNDLTECQIQTFFPLSVKLITIIWKPKELNETENPVHLWDT